MSKYVVLVADDDEDRWAAAPPEERQLTYDADLRFVEALVARGGTVVGGSELSHSRRTRVVDRGGAVTDGPYAKAAEQISGFYIVECDSLDDLTEAVRPMLSVHHHVELRPVDDEAVEQP